MSSLFNFLIKTRIVVFLLLIGFVFTTLTGTIFESINLNQISLNLLKQIARNDEVSAITNHSEEDFSGNNKCHYQWLNAMISYYNDDIDRSKFIITFQCMHESIEMTNFLYPSDLVLAEAAYNLYPNEIAISYWLLEGVEKKDRTRAIFLARDILSQNPTDAVIWRRLGWLFRSNKQYEEGLQAYLKACEIDDRASNGCYYVGASYRTLGDPLKAIEYFRLSFYPPSWQEADKLEAQIATGEIVR